MPGEDEEALRELGERLREELQPVGVLENLLVDRIVSAYWRLSRLGRVEAGIFAWERYAELAERASQEARSYTKQEVSTTILIDSELPTTTVTDEKKYDEAISEPPNDGGDSEKAKPPRWGERSSATRTAPNAFSKLSRYETAIEREPLQGTARTPAPASRPPR